MVLGPWKAQGPMFRSNGRWEGARRPSVAQASCHGFTHRSPGSVPTAWEAGLELLLVQHREAAQEPAAHSKQEAELRF